MAGKNWQAGGLVSIPGRAVLCLVATIVPFGAASAWSDDSPAASFIGGLAGGGKGAAIGALAGGGAGTAGSAFTGNKQIVLPAETLLTFHLDHPIHITESGAEPEPQLQQPQQQ